MISIRNLSSSNHW